MKTSPSLDNILLIANGVSMDLADRVAKELGTGRTDMVRKTFADGELYHAFPCDISGRDLIIIAATPDDATRNCLT